MFGISAVDSNLQIEKTQFSERGGTRVQFTQVFKEVPVLNSGYLVGVDNDSHIYFVNGPYHPEVDIDVVPALSTEEAVTIVQSDFSSSGREEISTPVLGIFPNVDDESEDYILVYRIEAADKEGAVSWRYLINAHTGDIVEKVDLIERVNGSGSVYQTNPLRGGVVNKVFYNLNNVNPRLLDGTHVRVLNDSTSEASSSSATFVYTPSNTHFDEAMVYYHSDRFEIWLMNHGLPSNKVGKVTAHTENLAEYAATASASRIMYFSDGEGFTGLRNPTREAAVVAHEYMHVVSETYNSLTQNDHARAMDEAYSDYFGMAYTNQFISSSIIGEYIDEPSGLDYTRNLVNSRTLSEFNTIDLEPDFEVEEHDRSVIFSGALWDFRRDNDIDTENADAIILESLYNLGSNPSFLYGRIGLKTAASALGFSQYWDDIDAAFDNHGIYQPVTVVISGVTGLYCGGYSGWTANVTYGPPGAITYQWSYKLDGSSTWQNLGTAQTQYWGMGPVGFTLRCNVTKGGQNGSDEHYVAHLGGSCKQGIDEETTSSKPLPTEFTLKANYPNPFNPETVIEYGLPEAGDVQLQIANLLGQTVRTLVSGPQDAGWHNAVWDGRNVSGQQVSSGTYLYRIVVTSSSGEILFTESRQMLLAK